MSIAAGISIVILLILLAISLYYLIKFGLIILEIQDAVEEAINVLDDRYDSMNDVIQTPLFYDSPEVRKVLRDIRLSREAVLEIAYALSAIDKNSEEVIPPSEEEGTIL